MVELMREDMGLNKSIIVQFGIYIKQIATFQLGESVFSGHKVSFLLKQRLQPTLALATMGLSMAIIIAVPLGVLAAWKFNTWIDRVVMVFALVGYAVPYFFLGYMLMWGFAVKIHIFPAAVTYTSAKTSASGSPPVAACHAAGHNRRRAHNQDDPCHHARGAEGRLR